MLMRAAVLSGALLAAVLLAVPAGADPIVSPELERTLMREFGVSAETIDQVADVGLGHDDIVVTFFVAQRAKMSPVQVATLRQQGGSWQGIADRRGLRPADFYVMVNGEIPSARYASILGKFGMLPTSDWRKLPLRDDEIIDLVHLKFVASGYDYSVFETMALREEGKEFAQILEEVAARKQQALEEEKRERKVRYAATSAE